ncbi:hypothetical protein [Actinacidiphila sp. bgisy144]|uniref:hypothetical protein n=1 Tax=Actinacidiphila sp. bgisy144 TaxID=3413791 RepID=UPI003EBDB6E6
MTSAYDDISEMHGLAERVHLVAEDLAVLDSPSSRCDFDDLDRWMREIATVVAHMTTAAAHADRSLDGALRYPAVTQNKIVALAESVRVLTQALARLGDAMAQAGLLRQLEPEAWNGQHVRARRVARDTVQGHLVRARLHLNDGGYQLHRAADRLLASLPPGTIWSQSTSPPQAPPTTPSPRTR